MKTKSIKLENLDFLLIALHAIYWSHVKTFPIVYGSVFLLKLYKLRLSNIVCLFYAKHINSDNRIESINIIQNILIILCEKSIQNISLVVLLENQNSYRAYNNYLRKYRIAFRKSYSRKFIGNDFYDNNSCIDTLALTNLRMVLLCSNLNGTYILWLYLNHYNFRKLTLIQKK